jgi:hypothetical protein
MALIGTISSEGLHFRNRIINGDMRIDQRNAGASVNNATSGGLSYTLDRWGTIASESSKFSVQQNAALATPPAGFTNYLGITSSSAYSVTSSDYFAIGQFIEGFNVADLAWGTAEAKAVILSFCVRSSLTGTFGGSLRNSAGNRSYPFTYTISSANTWETKSVAISGDTSGTWLTTNGIGIRLVFGLGVGSTSAGTAGSWAGANYLSVTGAVSVVGTNGATFYITGVQLEVGTVATPFERRPFGMELALCQRYLPAYRRNGNDPICMGQTTSNTSAGFLFPLPVTPRVAPTGVVISGASNFYVLSPDASAGFVCSALTFSSGTNVSAAFNATFPNNSGAAGQANILHSNTANAFFYFTGCEL